MKLKNTSQLPVDENKEANRHELIKIFNKRSMTDEELFVNFGLFIRSGALAKILFLDEIYRLIIGKPGVILEFGVWYGQSISVFENLRAVHEPYNYLRNIIGFDTFDGYKGNSNQDLKLSNLSKDSYMLSKNYENTLSKIIDIHEKENTMSHIKKHNLIKGDVSETFPIWLKNNPSKIIALAYLDLALYRPLKTVLQLIKKKIIPGSVIVLDEFNNDLYPGATKAVLETLDLDKFTINSSKILSDRTILIAK